MSNNDFQADAIVTLERSALDRWGNGDPQGYLETCAAEITYFDPFQERRLDGHPAMQELLMPLTGRIKVDRYDMLAPRVQRVGDMAVLSYNLVNHVTLPNGAASAVRWNATAVYARIDRQWKMVHNHWSFTHPDLKNPIEE